MSDVGYHNNEDLNLSEQLKDLDDALTELAATEHDGISENFDSLGATSKCLKDNNSMDTEEFHHCSSASSEEHQLNGTEQAGEQLLTNGDQNGFEEHEECGENGFALPEVEPVQDTCGDDVVFVPFDQDATTDVQDVSDDVVNISGDRSSSESPEVIHEAFDVPESMDHEATENCSSAELEEGLNPDDSAANGTTNVSSEEEPAVEEVDAVVVCEPESSHLESPQDVATNGIDDDVPVSSGTDAVELLESDTANADCSQPAEPAVESSIPNDESLDGSVASIHNDEDTDVLDDTTAPVSSSQSTTTTVELQVPSTSVITEAVPVVPAPISSTELLEAETKDSSDSDIEVITEKASAASAAKKPKICYEILSLLERWADDRFGSAQVTSPVELEETLMESVVRHILKEQAQYPSLISELEQKGFTIPMNVFLPPSQIAVLMAEYPSEKRIRSMLGNAKAEPLSGRFSWAPCPKMTEIVSDIGYSLAVESVYTEMVKKCERNNLKKEKEEMGKNKEASAVVKEDSKESEKQTEKEKPKESTANAEPSVKSASTDKADAALAITAARSSDTTKLTDQLDRIKKSLEEVRQFNKVFQVDAVHSCPSCSFKTDSELVLAHHMSTPDWLHDYHGGGMFQCHVCRLLLKDKEEMAEHYVEVHASLFVLENTTNQKCSCPLCPQNFQYKGTLQQHLKTCRRSFNARRNLSPCEDDLLHINRLFWALSRRQLQAVQQQMAARSGANRGAAVGSAAGAHSSGSVQQNVLRSAKTMPLPSSTPKTNLSQTAGGRMLMSEHHTMGIRASASNFPILPKGAPPPSHASLRVALPGIGNAIRPGAAGVSGMSMRVGAPMMQQNRLRPVMPRIRTPRPDITAFLQEQMRFAGNNAGSISPMLGKMMRPQTNVRQQLGAMGQTTGGRGPAPKVTGSALPSTSMVPGGGLRSVGGSATARLPNAAPGSVGMRSSGGAGSMAAANMRNNSSVRPTSLAQLAQQFVCEICDAALNSMVFYLVHLQNIHKKFLGKTISDMEGLPPLACSRCQGRFYCYEGLERHLLMTHGLVTKDLLVKAQHKSDAGRCKLCNKIFAFNLLHHMAVTHKKQLCSAEIMYSCDLCKGTFNQYSALEAHLLAKHKGVGASRAASVSTAKQQQQSSTSDALQLPKFSGQNFAAGTTSSLLGKRIAPSQPGASGIGTQSQLSGGPPPSKMMRTAGSTTQLRQPMNLGNMRPQMTSSSYATNARPQLNNTGTSAMLKPGPQAKSVRYNCTPCGIKFTVYEDVLNHWKLKHLKPVAVKLCRFNACSTCREDITKHCKLTSDVEQKLQTNSAFASGGEHFGDLHSFLLAAVGDSEVIEQERGEEDHLGNASCFKTAQNDATNDEDDIICLD